MFTLSKLGNHSLHKSARKEILGAANLSRGRGVIGRPDPLEKGDTRPRLSLRIQSSTYSSVPWTFRRFVSPANLPFGQERRVMAEFVSYPRLHVL